MRAGAASLPPSRLERAAAAVVVVVIVVVAAKARVVIVCVRWVAETEARIV